MTTELKKPRPSSLSRVLACAASVHESAKYPESVESAEATDGQKLHAGMAHIFRNLDKGLEAALQFMATNMAFTDPELAVCEEAYQLAVQGPLMGWDLLSPDVIVYVEQHVNVGFMGLDEDKGTLDLLVVNLKLRQFVLADWKFGVQPVARPKENPQLITYALGGMALHKGALDGGDLCVIAPRCFKEDERRMADTMDRAQLIAMAKLISDGVKKSMLPGQPFNPGETACMFCWAKDGCTARAAWLKEKEDVKTAHRLEVVTAGTPVTVQLTDPVPFPEKPLVVLSAELIQRSEEFKTQALAMKVTDDKSAIEAATLGKSGRTVFNLVDKQAKTVSRPYYDVYKAVLDAAKVVLNNIEQGEGHIKKELDAKAQRDYDAEMALIRAKNKAEEDRLKAEQAEAAAARARNPEKKAEKEAEAKALAQQAQQSTQALATAPPPAAPAAKTSGYKPTLVTYSSIPDITKVPAGWMARVLIVDQKELDRLVASKKLDKTFFCHLCASLRGPGGKGWVSVAGLWSSSWW